MIDVESELHSIGEMAQVSGLTVSALRFYDGAGVLVPAAVDRETGYRRYAEHQIRPARLLACLRRVGMPLVDLTEVLGRLPDDPDGVRRILQAHLCRLEDGLVAARRELSRAHALLEPEEKIMTRSTGFTVSGGDLAAASAAVRFAIGRDPELPMLGGVWFEVDGDVLHLVATDRFRLAVSQAPLREVSGAQVGAIVPAGFLTELASAGLAEAASVRLTLDDARITAELAGRRVGAELLRYDFPDYRRLLADSVPAQPLETVTVDVPALRSALTSAGTPTVVREYEGVRYDVAVLAVGSRGALDVVPADAVDPHDPRYIAVNREFLLQALDAADHGQLALGLDGPIKPLAVRIPDDDRTFSILMPVRL